MAEGMDDEQRRRWAEQWARQSGREPGTATAGPDAGEPTSWQPEDLEDVDLAGSGDDETIARWLTEDQGGDALPGGADRRARIVRDARRIAERAVNDSAVPGRYHKLIRRYFERLQRTVDEAPGTPPPDPP
jgi:hypothetical protein